MAKSEPPTHQHKIKILMNKIYKPENDLLLWLMTFSFLNNLNNFQTIINNKIENSVKIDVESIFYWAPQL